MNRYVATFIVSCLAIVVANIIVKMMFPQQVIVLQQPQVSIRGER